MATIFWEGRGLPTPVRDGYSYTPGDTSMETTMDSGVVKKRRRYSTGVDLITIKMIATYAEWLKIYDFFVNTTHSGVDVFLFPDPMNTSTSWRVRFKKDTLKMSVASAVDFDVSFTLEKMP